MGWLLDTNIVSQLAPGRRAQTSTSHLAAWQLDSDAEAPDGRSVHLSTTKLTAP